MKLNRSSGITILVILFLVGALVIGLMYNSAGKTRKLTQGNLDTARASQAALQKSKADLAAQMAQAVADAAAWNSKIALLQIELSKANSSLKLSESNFPLSVQSIEYYELLTGLASSSNLTFKTVAATEPTQTGLGTSGVTFYTSVFTVEVSGKLSDIIDFMDKIATNGAFKSGAMAPLNFTVPAPVSQAVKDQMKADLMTKMAASINAGLSADQRLSIVEQAILGLLEEPSQSEDVATLTQEIKNIITVQFGQSIANSLAADIVIAAQQNLADSLISIVAQIYGDYIAQLIATGQQKLIPQFLGKFGTDIITALGDNVNGALPGDVINIITNDLNARVTAKINSMVSATDVDSTIAAQVAALELPSAQFTVAVYSYKGG